MKKSIDFGLDDHPEDDERPRTAWTVSATDDCDGCEDLRIEVALEEVGRHGEATTAHLDAGTARRVRAALGAALREIGEPPD